MSSWFGGGKKDPELDDLPQYDTFNDLAPQFQLTADHDPNHIFPEEYKLVEEVRNQCSDVSDWPVKYILVFLFARRHSVPHTVRLINKHLAWLKQLGLEPISEKNGRLYPFKLDEIDPAEKQYVLYGGHTLYKHNLIDKHDRILQYKIMRFWTPAGHNLKEYIASVLWWYYYTFQFVPLKYHRNGLAVVVDMKGMGWSNMEFSRETKDFLMNATAGLPGRMRICWLVNSNWMLSTAMAVIKYFLSAKILARMHTVNPDALTQEIPSENLPEDLGGTWKPDLRLEWYEAVEKMDKESELEKRRHKRGKKSNEETSSEGEGSEKTHKHKSDGEKSDTEEDKHHHHRHHEHHEHGHHEHHTKRHSDEEDDTTEHHHHHNH